MRPIYVVCFSTLGLLLYTALFFFFTFGSVEGGLWYGIFTKQPGTLWFDLIDHSGTGLRLKLLFIPQYLPCFLHAALRAQGLDYFIWITPENISQWIGEAFVLICLELLTWLLLQVLLKDLQSQKNSMQKRKRKRKRKVGWGLGSIHRVSI